MSDNFDRRAAEAQTAIADLIRAGGALREALRRSEEALAIAVDQRQRIEEAASHLEVFVEKRVDACPCSGGDCYACLQRVAALVAYRKARTGK